MSSTSLYGNVGNVTVSSKNLTTLYNTTTGNAVVVGNVSDRNFTTLYSGAAQSDVNPTRAYGNANVEAFLNVGTDGANTVQNINMNGTLTVGGESFLGPVGNVHITGGSSGQFLATDGAGNLTWLTGGSGGGNTVPYIHFDVTSSGNNQQFTDALLSSYANSNVMNVMKNGVNIQPSQYTISGTTLTINILLSSGDSIDVLAMGGGGGTVAGLPEEIQYNGGFGFAASSAMTFDVANSTTNLLNLSVTNSANLGSVGNVTIIGGTNGQFLSTDGNGNLSWATGGGGGGNGTPGGSNTEVQFNNNGSFGGNSNLTYNVSTGIVTIGSELTFTRAAANINFPTTIGYIRGQGLGILPTDIFFVDGTTAAQPTRFAGNVEFNTAFGPSLTYDVRLGNIAYVKISGGNIGDVITTNGSANLNWTNTVPFSNVANLANTATFANTAATVTTNAQPNITSTGTLTDLTVSGNVIVQRAYEKFIGVVAGSVGTINYDVLDQSILYYTQNSTGNVTLNLRGNSTSTLNSILPLGNTLTVVFLNKIGGTAYVNDTLQIDSVTVTPQWVNGDSPSVINPLTNCIQSYTYTIIKIGSASYTVLASLTEYQ